MNGTGVPQSLKRDDRPICSAAHPPVPKNKIVAHPPARRRDGAACPCAQAAQGRPSESSQASMKDRQKLAEEVQTNKHANKQTNKQTHRQKLARRCGLSSAPPQLCERAVSEMNGYARTHAEQRTETSEHTHTQANKINKQATSICMCMNIYVCTCAYTCRWLGCR